MIPAIDDGIFVTGAPRSGTTLLERLLAAQDGISMLSQPFPLLLLEAKRAFLATLGLDNEPYPIGHLFLERRYAGGALTAFLGGWHVTRADLDGWFARMAQYSGQYTKFDAGRLDAAFRHITPADDFAGVVNKLDRFLGTSPDARWYGSKETIGEEFVPALLDRGFRCVIILRDPRDIAASLNHGRGTEFSGSLKPTLFNVRTWRKSVAFALAYEGRPGFHWCRYEDLVTDPAGELVRLAETAGLGPVAPERVSGEIRDGAGAVWRGNSSHGEHHGVGTSSVGAYRHVLSREVAAMIEAACLPEMQWLGYETTLTRARACQVIDAFREPYQISRTELAADEATPENAAVEAGRLRRVTEPPADDSSLWFVLERAHARLRAAFQP